MQAKNQRRIPPGESDFLEVFRCPTESRLDLRGRSRGASKREIETDMTREIRASKTDAESIRKSLRREK
jgi:hypothetical protein